MTNMSLRTSVDHLKEKSPDVALHESKARSISLDNIDQYNTWSNRSPKAQRQDHHFLGTSPSSIFKLKGLKKKLHAIKLSKSNSDITAQNAGSTDANRLQPSYSGSNLHEGKSPYESRKTYVKDEMRKKSRTTDNNNLNHGSTLYDQLATSKPSISDKTDSASLNLKTSLNRGPNSIDYNDPFIVVDSFMNDDSFEDTGSQYETDEVDGGCPEYTALENERLVKKIEKTREELIRMQATKDENVKEYLKTADVTPESATNLKTKINFEKNNLKTNSTIQMLQKKLEKYQLQLKELEEHGIHGPRRIMRVVQDSVRSGASSITGAVAKPLGSFNQFMKKDKKTSSSENVRSIQTDDETERNYYNSIVSDDENNSGSSCSNQQLAHGMVDSSFNSERYLSKQHTIDREQINKLEKNNEVLKDSVNLLKEDLETVIRSLQEERYKTDQLRSQLNDMLNQWNDLTELHQNEMMGLKQEMDRTAEHIERIDYRFAERAAEVEEAVDSCTTRVTKMELQQHQHQQLLVSVDSYLDGSGNAKLLLSKLLSLVISIFAIFLVISTSLIKIIIPFTSTRLRIITFVVAISSIFILWRNSNHVVFQKILYCIENCFEAIFNLLPYGTAESNIDTTLELNDGEISKDR